MKSLATLLVAIVPAIPAAADWQEYARLSRVQMAADMNAIYAELEGAHLMDWSSPPEGAGVSKLVTEKPEWFASPEAQRIADIVISFQTSAGGWGKHIDLRTRPRQPGELPSNGAVGWKYAGTIDNAATTSELRFLARSEAAKPRAEVRAALLRGIDYLLRAQLPNGGWPQVWPLMGSYHDAVTFNDNAMVNVLRLLRDMAGGRAEFASIPAELRGRAGASVERGIACILASQVRVEGRATSWGQQHDALTLAPISARAFEMVALSTGESAGILRFLMEIETPDAATVAAIHAAAAWLRATAIEGSAWESVDGDMKLIAGAAPLWPRFCEIGTNRALFGDRDGSIHFDVREISRERRNGYAWYGDAPAGALTRYAKWIKR